MDEVVPLLIRNAQVLDPADGSAVAGQDVLIEDGRVTRVGPPGEAPPPTAQIVEAAGRFAVPGLIDMHAHPLNQKDPTAALELMFAHGITGFRQMSGTDELLRRRAAGEFTLPPRAPSLLATAGPLLMPDTAATPAAAVAEVGRQAGAGADFVKFGLVTPEVFTAALAAAREHGIATAGHLPAALDPRTAARDGFGAVEHLGPGVALLSACSTDEEQIREAARAAEPSVRMPRFPVPRKVLEHVFARVVLNPALLTGPEGIANIRHAVDTFDQGRAQDLAAVLHEHGTWQCPTLIRLKGQLLGDRPELVAGTELRFMSGAALGRWRGAARRFARLTADRRETFRRQYDLLRGLVGILDRAGVPIMAGTDAVGAVGVVPGASLHQEFEELVAAGLTPARVLRSATVDAATHLGLEGELGRIRQGFRADLLLVDGDPRDDVTALRRIHAIVHDGRHTPEPDLAAMTARLAGSQAA